MKLEFKLQSYVGECESDQGVCVKDLNINLENIKGVIEGPTCQMIDSYCQINLKIRNFELTENGKVSLKLSKDKRY